MIDSFKIEVLAMLAITLAIVGIVGLFVYGAIARTVVGEQFTEQQWFSAEQEYCASTYGMEAKAYIANNCGLLGCQEVERTKCVGDEGERQIDYETEIFCQYLWKGDVGLC